MTAWALPDNLKGCRQGVRKDKVGCWKGLQQALGDEWFAFRCTDTTDTVL